MSNNVPRELRLLLQRRQQNKLGGYRKVQSLKKIARQRNDNRGTKK